MRSIVRFEFNGGMADNHELNFYEAGRFQYGAARLLFTLEHFRQTGRTLQRIKGNINADIRVKAPIPGSFLQEIVAISTPAVDIAAKLPLKALLTYVMGLISPSKAKENAVDLAKEMRLQVEAVSGVANGSNLSTQKALEIAKIALEHNIRITDKLSDKYINIPKTISDLEDQLERERILQPFKKQIEGIDPETERYLIDRVRKTIPDIGMPLRRSATSVSVSTMNESEENSSRPIIRLDHEDVKEITDSRIDDVPTALIGSLKAYDRETGYGKFRTDGLEKPLTFRVPGASKNLYLNAILDAMKRSKIEASFYIMRNTSGNPTSLLFDKMIDLNPI